MWLRYCLKQTYQQLFPKKQVICAVIGGRFGTKHPNKPLDTPKKVSNTLAELYINRSVKNIT